MSPRITSIQVRRGTSAEWKSSNPVLLVGEIGFDTNTNRFKVGKKDNVTTKLLAWNDLEYQSPHFGDKKPGSSYTLTGDLYINPEGELEYFNGTDWVKVAGRENPVLEGNTTVSGSINVDGACFVGDLKPCTSGGNSLGSIGSGWSQVVLGDLVIAPGNSSADDSNEIVLQINGDDIATRSELENLNTTNLPLYIQFQDNGMPLPIPNIVEGLVDVLELPPFENIYSQAHANQYFLTSLQSIDDSVESILGYGSKAGLPVDFDSRATFTEQVTADKGVMVPSIGNITVYPGTPESRYFLKASGTVSDRLPMEQSYWQDLTYLP